MVIGILIVLQLNTMKENQLTKIDAQLNYEKNIVAIAKPIIPLLLTVVLLQV